MTENRYAVYRVLGHNERYRIQETAVVRRQVPVGPASLASDLMKQWGMVSGETDGEDSSGRQKARLLAPDEVAARACDVAESAWREFERRGWMLDTPPPELEDE